MRRWLCLPVLLFLPCLVGCSVFPRLTSKPGVPTSAQKSVVKRSSKPTIVVSRPDQPVTVVAQQEEVETTVEYTSTPEKLTFAQRIGRLIARLGTIAVVLLIVGLIVCPGAVVGFLVKTVKKWRAAAIETWKAIRKSDGTKLPELKAALKESQSQKTKELVAIQKANGL